MWGQVWTGVALGAGEASFTGSARGRLRCCPSSLLAGRGSQHHPSAFPAAFPPPAPPSATPHTGLERGRGVEVWQAGGPREGGTLGRCLPQVAARSGLSPRARAALWW